MKKALYKSIALHLTMVLIFTVNLPLFWGSKRATVSQVPIIVDLKDVKLSEMTNLPPKAKVGKEDKEASTIKRKMNENYKTPEAEVKPVQKTKPEETETSDTTVDNSLATPPKQDYLDPPKASSKPKIPPKPSAKPKPPVSAAKSPAKPADKDKPALANPLKSLLASVDSLEKNIGNTSQVATVKEGTAVNNMGIEGGTGGSYFSELSISEIDAIAGRLRACWNLDPGAKGAQNMIIEIRAYLNRDGSVKEARIIDSSRYNGDPHFRSVADSARRAVYICGERDKATNRNAYSIFSEKYAEKYELWSTMLLRFNPLDGNVN